MSTMVVNCFSEALKRNVTFHAVLPVDKRSFDGAGPRDDRPMKTLYLLHGVYEDGSKWLNHTRVAMWAQDWNLAVIMPSGENKFYCDNPASNDNFAQFVGDDLVKLTRRLFNLSHKREDTYVAGLSMGGEGALKYAVNHPDKFGAVAVLSMYARDWRAMNPAEGFDEKRTLNSYKNAGGYEKFLNSYEDIRGLMQKNKDKLPPMYFACGKNDFLYEGYCEFKNWLTENGFDARFEEVDCYTHEWRFWDLAIQHDMDFFGLEDITDQGNPL